MLDVTTTVGVEDSGIHHFGKTNALAFLHFLNTARVALLSWLFCDDPVVFLGISHAKSRLQHIFLADSEGAHINYLVLKAFKAGFCVRAFGLDGQTEKSRDSTTDLARVSRMLGKGLTTVAYLWPRRGRDFGLALIEESDGAVGKVDAKARRNGQTPLIPETGRYSDVRTLTKICNGLASGHCKHNNLWSASVSFDAYTMRLLTL